MLKHWRQLLRSCFLLSTNLIAHPPSLFTPLPQTLHPASFTEYLLANAHELSIMGTGVLNQDSIATFLADYISSGLPIDTFGDGTVKDGIGAHGWHIRPTLDLTHDRHSIESAAQTDGHQETISSLRTESAAALAALYFLRSPKYEKNHDLSHPESYGAMKGRSAHGALNSVQLALEQS